MPIYSRKAIDYSAGFIISEEETLRPNKIGTWVMTTDECEEYLKERRKKNGY